MSNAILTKKVKEQSPDVQRLVASKPFIEANTLPITLGEIKEKHLIPVFIKDNEPVISHGEFIEVAGEVIGHSFKGKLVSQPDVRVSHPIMGRIPEARNKAAKDLRDEEKTIYYERMAFIYELLDISTEIAGQQLSLTIGGIKACNLDNFYARKGSGEHFKMFIGFQNKVCCNMCIWTDGYVSNFKAHSAKQLMDGLYDMIQRYSAEQHIKSLQDLPDYHLTEHQFAQLIGKARLYPNLPIEMKRKVPALLFNDTQVGTLVRDYYKDSNFARDNDGNLSLWNMYNLLTGVNKSSYLDSFLDRSCNAYDFVMQIKAGLQEGSGCWFLN